MATVGAGRDERGQLGRDERGQLGLDERGQLLLLAAIGIGVLFVILAMFLNTAIYTEVSATTNTDVREGQAVVQHQNEVEDVLNELLERSNQNDAASHEERYEQLDADIEAWNGLVSRHSATDRTLTRTTLVGVTNVTYVVQDEPSRHFTDRNGAANWTLTDVGADVRDFRLYATADSLTDVGNQSCSGSADCFTVTVDDGSDTWRLFVYSTDGSDVAIEVENASGETGVCSTTSSSAVVNVTAGTLDGEDCQPLSFAAGVDGPYTVSYENADAVRGSYVLLVEGSVSPSVHYGTNDSPYLDPKIEAATVHVRYETADVHYTTQQTANVTVTVDDIPGVTFSADEVSASDSSVAADPIDGIVADGEDHSTVTVTVYDSEGNVVDGLDAGNFSIDAEGASTTPVTESAGAGNYSFDLTHTVAETVNVTVEVDGVELDDVPEVTFVSGPVNATESSVVAEPTTGVVADGADNSTLTLTVRDAQGNPITGLDSETFEFESDGEDATFGNVSEVGDGSYTTTLTSTVAETVTITVAVDDVTLDDQPTVEFGSGSVDATTSTVVADPSTDVLADGEDHSTLTVTVRDAAENPITDLSAGNFSIDAEGAVNGSIATDGSGNYSFDLTHTVAETVNVTVTVDGVELDDVPEVTFVAGSVDITESSVVADPTTGVVADGADYSTITVTVRDAEGNPITDLTADDFEIDLPANASNTAVDTDAADEGMYTFEVTSTDAGTISVTVVVDGVELDPVPVEFVPGTVNASTSSVDADPETGVVADGEDYSTLTITVLDAQENPITDLDSEAFDLTSDGEGASFGTVSEVGDGVYTTTLTSTVAETVTVTVAVNEVTLDDQPTVEFDSGDSDG